MIYETLTNGMGVDWECENICFAEARAPRGYFVQAWERRRRNRDCGLNPYEPQRYRVMFSDTDNAGSNG